MKEKLEIDKFLSKDRFHDKNKDQLANQEENSSQSEENDNNGNHWKLAEVLGALLKICNSELEKNQILEFIKDIDELSDITINSIKDICKTRGCDVNIESLVAVKLIDYRIPFVLEVSANKYLLVIAKDKESFSLMLANGQIEKINQKLFLKKYKNSLILKMLINPPHEIEDASEKISDGSLNTKHPENSKSGSASANAGGINIDPEKENIEKAKKFKSFMIKTIWQDQHKLILACVLAAALSNMFLLVTPIFMMVTYDKVVPHLALSTLWVLAIGALIAFAADFYARFIRGKLQDAIAVKVSSDLSVSLFNKGLRLKYNQAPFYMRRYGFIAKDMAGNAVAITTIIVCLCIDIPFFFILTFYIFSFAHWVVFAPLLSLAIIHAIYYWITSVKQQADQKTQAWNGTKFKIIETLPSLIGSIIPLNAGRLLMGRFEKSMDNSMELEHNQRIRTQIFSFASMVLAQISIVIGIIIAVYQISFGVMSAASLAGCSLLIGRLISLLTPFYSSMMRIKMQTSQMATIHDLMQAVPITNCKDALLTDASKTAEIELREISYVYAGEEKAVINKLSLAIGKNEHLALVGPSASGKSTLLQIISGLLEPSSGEILYNGSAYSHYDYLDLKKSFCYLPQSDAFVTDTILENIYFGSRSFKEETLEKVLQITGLKKFMEKKSKGLSTLVHPSAKNLSLSERQIIVLARTLIRQPQHLILDNPLSTVDDTTYRQIMVNIANEYKNKTFIVATTSPFNISFMQKMAVMNNGFLVAYGTYQDVLEKLRGGNKNKKNISENINKNSESISIKKAVS